MILPKFVNKDKYGKLINFFSSFGDIASKTGNFLFDSFTNSIDSLVDNFFGTGLTPAQKEANQFTADQAEVAYERQKEFYERYQSIGAQVEQAKAAGVNPAALYGNLSGGSAPSVPQASGSVSPDSSPVDNLLGLAQMLFTMNETKRMNDVKKDNIAADTENKATNTEGAKISNQFLETYYVLREKGLEAALRQTESAISVNEQNVLESQSRQALNLSIKALNECDLKTRSEINDLAVRYMTAEASMLEDKALQYKQELQVNLANIIADTQLKNASSSQIRKYCQIMLNNEEYGVTKKDGTRSKKVSLLEQSVLSEIETVSKMTDAQIEHMRKEDKYAWTKAVTAISTGIAAGGALYLGSRKLSRSTDNFLSTVD